MASIVPMNEFHTELVKKLNNEIQEKVLEKCHSEPNMSTIIRQAVTRRESSPNMSVIAGKLNLPRRGGVYNSTSFNLKAKTAKMELQNTLEMEIKKAKEKLIETKKKLALFSPIDSSASKNAAREEYYQAEKDVEEACKNLVMLYRA